MAPDEQSAACYPETVHSPLRCWCSPSCRSLPGAQRMQADERARSGSVWRGWPGWRAWLRASCEGLKVSGRKVEAWRRRIAMELTSSTGPGCTYTYGRVTLPHLMAPMVQTLEDQSGLLWPAWTLVLPFHLPSINHLFCLVRKWLANPWLTFLLHYALVAKVQQKINAYENECSQIF